jgi:hypothetical protein
MRFLLASRFQLRIQKAIDPEKLISLMRVTQNKRLLKPRSKRKKLWLCRLK